MQRQRQHQQPSQRLFAVSELAQFEYCPLLWWHEQFDPLEQSETEDLFARMVELEHDHGQPATTLPEYQVIEQLLLRRGAFEAGPRDDPDDDDALSERDQELLEPAHRSSYTRTLILTALVLLVLALLLLTLSLLLASSGGNISGIALSTGLALLTIALILALLFINERRFQQDRLQSQRRRDLGLPTGELIYEDADGEGEPLTSREAPLAGKPTFIIQLPDGRPVPIVETRQNNRQNLKEPESRHIIQVVAYCLILEDYFEEQPTHGVLRYADREFVVDYTPALRKKVLRLLKDMDNCSEHYPPSLTRQRPAKCRSCLFQPICPVGQGK